MSAAVQRDGTEDWLAAWDSATEEDRRLVLATVGERMAALSAPETTYRRLITAPTTFVIAARRSGTALVVATCSHYRDSIDNATEGIPVIPTDYHYVHVEIDELVVEHATLTSRATLLSDEIFHLEPGPDEPDPPDDRPEVRAIADAFLTTYPALSHVKQKTQAVLEARSDGPTWVRPPTVRVLAAVPAGPRIVVTTVSSFRLQHASQSEEWGTVYLTIDEVTTEDGNVVADAQRLADTIELGQHELDTHDDAAAERAFVTRYLAACKDWRVVWYAADERERTAARERAFTIVNSQCGHEVRSEMAENWVDPDPEPIAAHREGKLLVAAFAWTYWIGALERGSEQSIGVLQITVDGNQVVRERSLTSAVIPVTVPREQHDAMKTYRDELPAMRDRAAVIAHVEARLRRDCDAESKRLAYVIREPEVRIVRVVGSVFTTVGYYRLGIREQVGRDRIERIVEVATVTVDNGVVIDMRSLHRAWGQMDEAQSDDTAVGNQLDQEHVNHLIDLVHEGRFDT
ncbi:MAG TPA: hypothetical protein VFQ53_41375 [Kofleriaceae bacterium]|nr:hypothetical protein [Kofleriaceae bacterium]